MEAREIAPIGHRIDARVSVPGSKSATNRALLLAALADGATVLHGAVRCDDSDRMVDGLERLGFVVGSHPTAAQNARVADLTLVDAHAVGQPDATPGDEQAPRQLDVTPGDERNVRLVDATPVRGAGGRVPRAGAALDVGNAGTAARFLTALATLGRGRFVIDGDSRMRERPIGDLVDALAQLGATVRATDGCPPVTVAASGLRGGRTTVSGTVSSQFLSALLMVAPCAGSPVVIDITGELSSRPYVDLTVAMMRDFGIEVQREDNHRFLVVPAPYRSPGVYHIEPDASSASYVYAAAAIVGGRAVVNGVTRECRQGDVGFVDVLERMGCAIAPTADGLLVERTGALDGVDVDLCDMPDVAPTLAVVAPFARSQTTIRGIASARRKECDRVTALCCELFRMGVQVTERRDGLTIQPCDHVTPARIRTYNDHRMAMAFALVGLRCPGIAVENPGCVSKTFPDYFAMLEELRS